MKLESPSILTKNSFLPSHWGGWAPPLSTPVADGCTNENSWSHVLQAGYIFHDDTHRHIYTHPFSGPLPGTTRVGRYQKGKTNLDFTEARDSEWQWHQLGHMQVCTALQTDNHASTPTLCFLQARCPSYRPTNSVKALQVMIVMMIVDCFM